MGTPVIYVGLGSMRSLGAVHSVAGLAKAAIEGMCRVLCVCVCVCVCVCTCIPVYLCAYGFVCACMLRVSGCACVRVHAGVRVRACKCVSESIVGPKAPALNCTHVRSNERSSIQGPVPMWNILPGISSLSRHF